MTPHDLSRANRFALAFGYVAVGVYFFTVLAALLS